MLRLHKHRLHQYWKTAEMSATGQAGENLLFLVDYLLRVLRVLLLLSIWRTVLAGRGEVSGMTLASVLTYTLIAEVFADQLAARTGIENAMWEGTLTRHFLQPMGLVGQFVADMVGRWALNLVAFSLPLLLLSPLLGVDPRPASAPLAGLFALSLVLAVAVGTAIDFCFGALAAALRQNIWQVTHVRNALATILSGALLPLALLPWGLGDVFAWLPFAATASAPLRIYTGTGDPLPLLLRQVVWCVVLWPLANWMWRAHREKLAFQGG